MYNPIQAVAGISHLQANEVGEGRGYEGKTGNTGKAMIFTIDANTASLTTLAAAFPKAGASALNKMAQQAKSEASRRIRSRYNIKKGDLDSNFRLRRASVNNLSAIVTASGNPLPLYDFGARQTKAGVSVMVLKGQRKVVQPIDGRRAFIATMSSGHVGVFVRKGKSRLPIQELSSLSIPQMFGTKNVMGALTAFVNERLRPLLVHEIEFFRGKAA